MIDELKKMTDNELEEIVIKGENLNIPTSRAATAKRILDSRKLSKFQQGLHSVMTVAETLSKINQPLLQLPNFASANATISAVASVTESLNNIPKIYAAAMGVPSMNAINPLISTIQNVQQIAGTSIWKEIANNTINSPILDVVNSLQSLTIPQVYVPIPEKSHPKPIIPKKLAQEISSATSQKADTIYNFPAYKYFFHLETFLRSFIKINIVEPNKDQLESKLPQGMIEEWKRKKQSEEDNVHADHVSYDLIEYSDFTDLKKILEKKSTLPLVRHLINEENLKTITSKLHELEPVRLKIAHSRAVTEKEFETLRVYADKIKRILPAK